MAQIAALIAAAGTEAAAVGTAEAAAAAAAAETAAATTAALAPEAAAAMYAAEFIPAAAAEAAALTPQLAAQLTGAEAVAAGAPAMSQAASTVTPYLDVGMQSVAAPSYVTPEALEAARSAAPSGIETVAPSAAVKEATSAELLKAIEAAEAAGKPGFFSDFAAKWDKLPFEKKLYYGLMGSGGLGSLVQGLTTKTPELKKYSGPLSRYKFDPKRYRPSRLADGGIVALMQGGTSDLGAYSDGGRMLKGPGDGMSDNIPGVIGGKRPARLADGEFVVPADVVSHLGNGSTDAGAKQLYAMMDRVRQARTGTKKQGRQIRPGRMMPA